MNASKNILITGATGLIGTRLTELLVKRGDSVAHLGRSKKTSSSVRSFTWNVDKGQIDQATLVGVDTIVHLAGAGVAEKRWTAQRKVEILESRTKSTQLLYAELKKNTHSVNSVICASAIGYYGFDNNDGLLTEGNSPGTDFLADVTRQWEEEVDRIQDLGIRVVKIRIGIVLSEKGGALKEVANPVKYLVGAPLGSGEQIISWIHIDDLCGIFIKAIDDNSMKGAFNGVAPNPVSNREMTKAIAKTLHKPLILPAVPGFMLKIILGEMADIVLTGMKVSPEKIINAGYVFQFTKLKNALSDLLSKS